MITIPGDDVRTEKLIGRMNDANYETDDVTAQCVTLGRGEVGLLEPVLISLVIAEPHLRCEEDQLLLHVGGDPRLQKPSGCSHIHDLDKTSEVVSQVGWIVKYFIPKLFNLRYPGDILEESDEIPPDDQDIIEPITNQ